MFNGNPLVVHIVAARKFTYWELRTSYIDSTLFSLPTGITESTGIIPVVGLFHPDIYGGAEDPPTPDLLFDFRPDTVYLLHPNLGVNES